MSRGGVNDRPLTPKVIKEVNIVSRIHIIRSALLRLGGGDGMVVVVAVKMVGASTKLMMGDGSTVSMMVDEEQR